MPRVNLKSLTIPDNSNDLRSTINNISRTKVWNPIDHSGLTIYNLTNKGELCPGIYVWNGNSWVRIQEPYPVKCLPPVITIHPAGTTICPGATHILTISANNTIPSTYQ